MALGMGGLRMVWRLPMSECAPMARKKSVTKKHTHKNEETEHVAA